MINARREIKKKEQKNLERTKDVRVNRERQRERERERENTAGHDSIEKEDMGSGRYDEENGGIMKKVNRVGFYGCCCCWWWWGGGF